MLESFTRTVIDPLLLAAGAAAPLAVYPFDVAARASAETVDRLLANTLLTPPPFIRKRSAAESLSHQDRIFGLRLVGDFYRFEEKPDERPPLFPRPEPIDPSVRQVGAFTRDGEVLELSWPSDFEPIWSTRTLVEKVLANLEPSVEIPKELGRVFGDSSRIDRRFTLREKYLGVKNNCTARARWFRHREGPRPCAVLLHGYMSGFMPVERWLWPVGRLFKGGMDVVLSVLPFHGPRRDTRRGVMPPAFPSNDPRFTVEGFRQMVSDQTALFDFLLDGRATSLGIMGMSLGGYGAALLSTIEPRLSFTVLYIALAQIEDFALRFGRMIGSEQEQAEQAEALRRAQWAINPLARPSLVPSDRIKVIGGRYDRVTGLSHAETLARHFGVSVEVFDGGHILQGNLTKAFESAFQMLREAGYWSV